MMPGIHISDLDAFSHGFFQDILTLMKELGKDNLTKEEVDKFLGDKLTEGRKSKPKLKRRTRGRGSGPTRGGGRRRR